MLKEEGGNGMDEGALETVEIAEESHGRGSRVGPKDQEERGLGHLLASFFYTIFQMRKLRPREIK